MNHFRPLTHNQFQWLIGCTAGFIVWLNLSWLIHYAPNYNSAYLPYLISGFYRWIILVLWIILLILFGLNKPLKSFQWSVPIIAVLSLGRFISLEFLNDIHLTLEWITYDYVTKKLWLGVTFHFLFFYLFLHKLCGFGLKDFGVDAKHLGQGLIFLIASWIFFNAFDAISIYSKGNRPEIHSTWETVGAIFIIRDFLESLLGTVLFEEIFHRVILLQQCYFLISKQKENRYIPNSIKAIAFSSAVFAIYHLPVWLTRNHTITDFLFSTHSMSLPALFFIGVLYCLVIIHTNNVFIPVILHAFHNSSLALFDIHHWLYAEYIIIVLILLFWKKDPGNILNNYRYLPLGKPTEERMNV